MAAAEMALAKASELSTVRQALGQKSEALEDSAIAETRRVLDELLVVAIVASKVGGKAIRYMQDAAADRGVIQHVDDRAVHVGYGHAGLMVPDALRAKELPFVDVLQRKQRSVSLLALLAHGLCRHHHDVLEDLLGEIPMLGRRAPPDICGREERGDEHPGIVEDAVGSHRVDRSCDISSAADPSQPTLLGPARKALGGRGPVELQSGRDVIHMDYVSRRGQDADKLCSTLGKTRAVLFHMFDLA